LRVALGVRHRQTGSDEEETNAKSIASGSDQPPRSAGNLANDFGSFSNVAKSINTDGYDPQSRRSSGTGAPVAQGVPPGRAGIGNAIEIANTPRWSAGLRTGL
jgi:hypothetical protein